MNNFIHTEIKLVEPSFSSPLTDLVIELDHLRKKELKGSTHPHVFFQLKSVFQTIESIGSARIEGNNTTISEFIETQLEKREYVNEQIQEIRNIESCINFIEEESGEINLNRYFISTLHAEIVEGLMPPPQGERDKTPGAYRNHFVEIKGSNHKPPETQQQIMKVGS